MPAIASSYGIDFDVGRDRYPTRRANAPAQLRLKYALTTIDGALPVGHVRSNKKRARIVVATCRSITCGACGLVQDPAEMKKIGWSVMNGEALLLAVCVGCQSSRTIESLTGTCLCAGCRRLMIDEVKHCVLDIDGGSFALCDSCYLRDQRRNGWEYQGVPLVNRGR